MSSTEGGGGTVGAVSTDQTVINNISNNDSVGIDMPCTDVDLSSGELENFRSLYKALDGGQPTLRDKPLIRKVPSTLRRNEDFKKYFKPKVISIGPLHHDDPTLHESKELKLKLAAHFVKNIDYLKVYSNMKKEIDDLKKCYEPQELEKYSDDDEKLAWMFFVDGCAILQAVYLHFAPVNGGGSSIKESEFTYCIYYDNEARTKRCQSHTIPNVKELKKVGIWLKASETSRLTDISFNPIFFIGKLCLPPISVDDSTMNLIAYEMCPDFDNDFSVSSYMCFLDLLIDEAEDVKDLRDAGILYNRLGSDEEVAKLFNKMNTDLVPSPMIYSGVKWKIHNHCKTPWINHAAQGYHTYFRSPWTVFALAGAITALLLAAFQTYFTIHQPK
ncbi:hypothetical protein GOBAR_AA15962 [Gossypium barbadense]|uniref:Uncharacterized protein n=1 Tax=Gossypium barbadense TaxID=3634 RepID=A0A2P5XMU8_GOSBA|nr:hypothetical protein GOBAR_AA15962 [Gossypium barbadense]